jgi:hypothetical protein
MTKNIPAHSIKNAQVKNEIPAISLTQILFLVPLSVVRHCQPSQLS